MQVPMVQRYHVLGARGWARSPTRFCPWRLASRQAQLLRRHRDDSSHLSYPDNDSSQLQDYYYNKQNSLAFHRVPDLTGSLEAEFPNRPVNSRKKVGALL